MSTKTPGAKRATEDSATKKSAPVTGKRNAGRAQTDKLGKADAGKSKSLPVAAKKAAATAAGAKTPKVAAMSNKGLAASKKVSSAKPGSKAGTPKVAQKPTTARATKAVASRATTNARKPAATPPSAARDAAKVVKAKTAHGKADQDKAAKAVTTSNSKSSAVKGKTATNQVANAGRVEPTKNLSTTPEKTKAGAQQHHTTPAGGQQETTKLHTKASSRPAAASDSSTGAKTGEHRPESVATKKVDGKKGAAVTAKAPQSAAAAAFVAARKKMAAAAKPSPVLGKKSDIPGGGDPVAQKSVKKVEEKPVAPVVAPRAANEVRGPVAPAHGVPMAGVRPGAVPVARVAKPAGKPATFKALEYIVYPAHGVGQITTIETQEVAGYKLELYVISFVKDKMILKVPLPKIASVGMRKLAEAPVLKRALDTLTGRARVKRTMWSRRAQEYEAKINSGDLIAIAEVVRDLYRSDAQPEQSYSERQLYEAALDRMAREIAVVQDLTDTEALKLIDEQLQKGPRRGKAEEADNDDSEDGTETGIDEAA